MQGRRGDNWATSRPAPVTGVTDVLREGVSGDPLVHALLDTIDALVDMVKGGYCYRDRFDTCGDAFCVDAQRELAGILGPLRKIAGTGSDS